jgi:hypothetical protein
MNEAWRQRQIAHCLACIAEAEKAHSAEEIQRAEERARQWNAEIEGRREPIQQRLTLAA